MERIISLNITHPSQRTGQVEGFRFLWAYLVSGYRSDRHCQQCFYGRLSPDLSTSSDSVGVRIPLSLSKSHRFAYVCGVASGPRAQRGARNLHLPLRFAAGRTVEMTTYNGYDLRVSDAERVTIPALPDDWNGLHRDHARCKNFQFAVAMFDYPSAPKRGWPVSV